MALANSAPPVTLDELLKGFSRLGNIPEIEVEGISANSREIANGFVFVAQAGLTRHAIDFVEQAHAAGACAVLYDPLDQYAVSRVPMLQKQVDLAWVPVEHLHQLTGEIAARFYANPSESMKMVGVTGTDGKTSVTHLLVQSLIRMGSRAGSIGTLGYGVANRLTPTPYTTPDAVSVQRILAELRDRGCEFVVMEVSSHALEQYRVSGCRFDIAVLTNLGSDHLDYHGSADQYAAAKERLFISARLEGRVLNADDAFGERLARQYPGPRTVCYRTADEAPATTTGCTPVALLSSRLGKAGLALEIDIDGQPLHIDTQLIGNFNVDNLLACASTLAKLGFATTEIEGAMQGLRSIPGRMQYYPAQAGKPAVIIDFAHTEQALEACLLALQDFCRGDLYCLFGCGGNRDQSKRPRMAAVAERLVQHVIVTDDNPRFESPEDIVSDILKGFAEPAEIRVIHDRETAIETALQLAGDDDLVVIAGKGHEQVQIVGNQRIPYSDHEVVTRLLEAGHD